MVGENRNGLMMERNYFPIFLYIKKFFNTFFPKILFGLSPNRYWAQQHWKFQGKEDIHGFDKYSEGSEFFPVIIHEIQIRVKNHNSILDLGCNCGYCLNELKKEGYTNISGIDISPEAIAFGRENFNITDVSLILGSFEEILPKLVRQKKQFDLVYSVGATLELVHPSFDIIQHIAKISKGYVVLIIFEWGHSYPRFWEYEFNRNGFILVKCIRPFDGSTIRGDIYSIPSLMVFKKIDKELVKKIY